MNPILEASILKCVANPKDKMVNVRLTPAVHDQFKIACELRGASMSSLLHQFIVRTIREERELDPKAFERPHAKRPVLIENDLIPVAVHNEGVVNARAKPAAKKKKG
jgi:hypothetical protein